MIIEQDNTLKSENVMIEVRKLSLGERMKMEIIGCLLHSPKVIFLDEPTIGLDFLARQDIRNFLAQYNKQFNALIILTSHYLEDISELCKKLIIINDGNIVVDGETKTFYEKYRDKVIVRLKSADEKLLKKYGKYICKNSHEYFDILIPKTQEKEIFIDNPWRCIKFLKFNEI